MSAWGLADGRQRVLRGASREPSDDGPRVPRGPGLRKCADPGTGGRGPGTQRRVPPRGARHDRGTARRGRGAGEEATMSVTDLPMPGTTTVHGACPLDCPDTCALEVTVEDGRAVRVRGDRSHPYTRGGLCVKMNDYERTVYSPDRVLYPLRRTGPKGSGQFERISWDEIGRAHV